MSTTPELMTYRAIYVGRGLIDNKIVHGWVPEDAPEAEPSWFGKGRARAIGRTYVISAHREGNTFTRFMPGSEEFEGSYVGGDATRLGWEARDRQAYLRDQQRKDEARARREGVLDREAARLARNLLTGSRDFREVQTRLRMLTEAAIEAWNREERAP